jgi:competence protein ComEA
VEPSSTPPWRVLDTPTAEAAARLTAAPETKAMSSLTIKVAAALVAVAVCVAIAIVAATSGGGGEVRVDGASPFPDAQPSGDVGPSVAGAGSLGRGDVVVEIVGAVQAPGVYHLPSGARVADLLERAGGYGPRVDAARAEHELNLAAPVKDGEHIRVPSRDDGPEKPTPGTSGPASGGAGLVDINTATQAQLEALPGVGPATAQKIITAREEAPFGAVEELRSRGVLGEKTFDKLRPLITVG